MGWVRYALGLDERDRVSRWIGWLLGEVLPNPGVDRILVTQDAQPVLVTSTSFPSGQIFRFRSSLLPDIPTHFRSPDAGLASKGSI
jgi:hypothetical protein